MANLPPATRFADSRRAVRAVAIGLILCIGAVSAWAQDRAEPRRQATLTFKGRGGGTFQIIDHTIPGTKTATVEAPHLNQTTPEAIAAENARRLAIMDMVEALLQADREREAVQAQILDEALGVREKEAEEAAAAQQEQTLGLQRLQEKNWITYTSDDRTFPTMVFDPFSKQFLPTAEAIKSLASPPGILPGGLPVPSAPAAPPSSSPSDQGGASPQS